MIQTERQVSRTDTLYAVLRPYICVGEYATEAEARKALIERKAS